MKEHYLIYLANDWDAVFSCSEKKDGMIDRHSCIFGWMLKRGTFYRFKDEEDLKMAVGLVSALSIPCICFPVPEPLCYFIRCFSFSEFSPIVVSKRFAYLISSSFDNEDIIGIDDFKAIPIYYTDFFNRSHVVNYFFNFFDFKRSFSEFLLTFKNVDVNNGDIDVWFDNELQRSDL